MFFQSIKKKLRNKNIFWALLSLCLTALNVTFVVVNCFFTDSESRTPFTWLSAIIMFLIAVASGYLFFVSVKDIITNQAFRELLHAAEKIGEVSEVEQMLEALPKSDLAKGGDLRYNDTLLFYRKDGDVALIPAKEITAVLPVKTMQHSAAFYVEIQYCDKKVKINTREKDVAALAADITKCVNLTQ